LSAAPESVPDSTRLALARHGETVWHEEKRYAGGTSDIDLTAKGRQQAQALADWCRGRSLDAVVTSPVRRAIETARPSARVIGVELVIVDDLREVDFGIAEGRTAGELRDLDEGMMRRFQADPVAHPFPGAESPDAAAFRAANALRKVAEQFAGGSVLVVAHNTVLRLALCVLLGLPVSGYRQSFPRLDNAAVTELAVPIDPQRPVSLLSLNVEPDVT
jgi:broad specificity phosphatase PhoE